MMIMSWRKCVCSQQESYSAELKDDDEIAARLYELHGLAPWAWHYMSERLKKKYGIEEG